MTQRIKNDLAVQLAGFAGRVDRRKRAEKGGFGDLIRDVSGRSSAGPARTGRTRYSRLITTVQARRLAAYAPVIQRASQTYGVPVELICGVILQESGGSARAVSHCGAKGLMQLMPATARRLGVANSFDSVQNIMGGTRYLRELLNRFGGNVSLALAGYNAGEANVEKYGRRIPPFSETRAYVPGVLKYANALWNIFKSAPVRIASAPVHHRTIF